MRKRLVVFCFHIDLDGLGYNERELLKALHYRAKGHQVPWLLGAGNDIDSINLSSGEFHSPKKHYSQSWMNRFFIVTPFDPEKWAIYFSRYKNIGLARQESMRAMSAWFNMPTGTRLFLPNPYYEFISRSNLKPGWSIGDPSRTSACELTKFEQQYFHTFMSRMWIPVGSEGGIVDYGMNKWATSFVYNERKKSSSNASVSYKFGQGGCSILERGIDNYGISPLDGEYGFFSPQYLFDPINEEFLYPSDFTDLRSISSRGGQKIRQSSYLSNEYRFVQPAKANQSQSSIVYDGRFVLSFDEITNRDDNGDFIDPFTGNSVSAEDPHLSMELDPVFKSINRILTYRILNSNVSSPLPKQLNEWMNKTMNWNSTILMGLNSIPEMEKSKINYYPLLFTTGIDSNNSITIPISQNFPPQSSLNSYTLRTSYAGAYPSV